MKKRITLAALCGLLTGVAELTASASGAPFGEAEGAGGYLGDVSQAIPPRATPSAGGAAATGNPDDREALAATMALLEHELGNTRERLAAEARARETLESRMLDLAGENRELRGELETSRLLLTGAMTENERSRQETVKLQGDILFYALYLMESETRRGVETEETIALSRLPFRIDQNLARLFVDQEQNFLLPHNQAAREYLRSQGIAIPEAARGSEDVFKRFIDMKFVSRAARPEDSVKIAVSGSPNPLSGLFKVQNPHNDYLNIITGYPVLGRSPHERVIFGRPVDMYLSPLFLLRHEFRSGKAGHLSFLRDELNSKAEIVIFFMERKTRIDAHEFDCAYAVTTLEAIDKKSPRDIFRGPLMKYYTTSNGAIDRESFLNTPDYREIFMEMSQYDNHFTFELQA